VKRMDVFGPFRSVPPGVVLYDLPGVGDGNAALTRIANAWIEVCDDHFYLVDTLHLLQNDTYENILDVLASSLRSNRRLAVISTKALDMVNSSELCFELGRFGVTVTKAIVEGDMTRYRQVLLDKTRETVVARLIERLSSCEAAKLLENGLERMKLLISQIGRDYCREETAANSAKGMCTLMVFRFTLSVQMLSIWIQFRVRFGLSVLDFVRR
jgi:hypothetical protein